MSLAITVLENYIKSYSNTCMRCSPLQKSCLLSLREGDTIDPYHARGSLARGGEKLSFGTWLQKSRFWPVRGFRHTPLLDVA